MMLISRNLSLILRVVLICGLGLAGEGLAQRAGAQVAPAGIDPSAAKAVKQMSDSLAAAQKFSFSGTRTLDSELVPVPGTKPVKFVTKVQVTVARPDRFLFKVTGEEDARQFYFNGSEFNLYDAKSKSYSKVLTKSVNIDQLLGHLQTKWGFMPPVSDFIMSDSYKMLMADVKTARFVGTEIAGMNRVQHLAFTQDTVDWELWISEKTHLPKKLVIVFKQRKGSPSFEFDFDQWNLKATPSAKFFDFVPPSGSTEKDLVPLKKK